MPELQNPALEVINGVDQIDPHPLDEAVRSYRDAMRPPKKDLDVEFFMKTLRSVNESSALKVVRNPIDANGRWRRGATLRNVRSIELDEKGQLALRIRGDKTEYPVEKAIDEVMKLRARLSKEGPVMLTISDEKQVQITDAYSHAFVKDAWAGLPFDLVLAYFDESAASQREADVVIEGEEAQLTDDGAQAAGDGAQQ